MLKASMRGIRKMIDERSRRICEMLSYYNGDEKRFIKPPQDKRSIERKCLDLRREVKRLRVIKAEMNLIVQLNEMYHAK